MGDVPEWYSLIAAARYLGVAPWDLVDRPTAWAHMANAAMDAEHRARESS